MVTSVERFVWANDQQQTSIPSRLTYIFHPHSVGLRNFSQSFFIECSNGFDWVSGTVSAFRFTQCDIPLTVTLIKHANILGRNCSKCSCRCFRQSACYFSTGACVNLASHPSPCFFGSLLGDICKLRRSRESTSKLTNKWHFSGRISSLPVHLLDFIELFTTKIQFVLVSIVRGCNDAIFIWKKSSYIHQ